MRYSMARTYKVKQLKAQCLEIARGAGVFRDDELKVLYEVLSECFLKPGRPYKMCIEHDKGKMAGFIIYGKTACSVNGWDLYWICVDDKLKRKGIAQRLIGRMVLKISRENTDAVIRIETSSLARYLPARKLYQRCGFSLAGQLQNFYAKGDDLLIYSSPIGQLSAEPQSIFSSAQRDS